MLTRKTIPESIRKTVYLRDGKCCTICGIPLAFTAGVHDQGHVAQFGHTNPPLETAGPEMAELVRVVPDSRALKMNARKKAFMVRKIDSPDHLKTQCRTCNNTQGPRDLLRIPTAKERETIRIGNEAVRQRGKVLYGGENPILGPMPENFKSTYRKFSKSKKVVNRQNRNERAPALVKKGKGISIKDKVRLTATRKVYLRKPSR